MPAAETLLWSLGIEVVHTPFCVQACGCSIVVKRYRASRRSSSQGSTAQFSGDIAVSMSTEDSTYAVLRTPYTLTNELVSLFYLCDLMDARQSASRLLGIWFMPAVEVFCSLQASIRGWRTRTSGIITAAQTCSSMYSVFRQLLLIGGANFRPTRQ